MPASALTAESGSWRPSPGAELFSTVQSALGSLPCIAEDLKVITPDVCAFRDQFHLPEMRVLQFAFDGHSDHAHLSDNYVTDAVVCTGTHDNQARMNIPGRAGGNWLWRFTEDMLHDHAFEQVRNLTRSSIRLSCDRDSNEQKSPEVSSR